MTAEEFILITQQLRPQMMKVAMDFFHSQEDAEDVVQEVLMRMWKREWKADDDIRALAIKATKNMCVNIWRKQKLRLTIPMNEEEDTTLSHEETDQKVLMKEQKKMLEEAISHLPRSEQRLIRLRQESGLDSSEISAITGIPIRSISSMISSARKKILNYLNQYETATHTKIS